jgi:hypothetical protein
MCICIFLVKQSLEIGQVVAQSPSVLDQKHFPSPASQTAIPTNDSEIMLR